MSTAWNWPGSRWWRIDLHTHSPASHDFKPEADRTNPDWPRWVKAVRDAGLDAAAITDHNTAAGIAKLQEAAAGLDDPPVLFPGVEVTASDGVHLLLLMDPSCSHQHIDDLLTRVEIPVEQRGHQTARSSFNVEKILERCGDDALIVGAHVNGPDGLLGLEGRQRLAVLQDRNLAAVEVNPDLAIDDSGLDRRLPGIRRKSSRVWCSDGHSMSGLGRRFTWVKMTRPDLEGLRLALLDGPDSLEPADRGAPGNPNAHAALAIESITVEKARFIGRQSPVTVAFNPWLNAMIGGRGTGKSTLIDFCRKALRREAEFDGSDRSEDGSLRTLFDRRFEAALKSVPPERIDRLALYLPDDAVEVGFKDRTARSWQPLTRGSPGQQTAALLAFVLGCGSEPIILDQPEDDLDNTLIYELLVSRLRETKTRRQVIVVTHNPNIVVHGDAELVLSLKAAKGQSRIDCQGGLQERDVRDVICRVMEGGREAFESRYRRIIPPGNSAP